MIICIRRHQTRKCQVGSVNYHRYAPGSVRAGTERHQKVSGRVRLSLLPFVLSFDISISFLGRLVCDLCTIL